MPEVQEFGRELIEVLNELRVVLPGVQVLFGFLLTMPFYTRFEQLSAHERTVYFFAFASSAAASICLMAPSLYHRLHWRRDVQDKELMLRTFNRLAIAGGTFLAAAMILTMYDVAHLLFGAATANWIGGIAVLSFGWMWYGLPLSRRQRERARAHHAESDPHES